MRKDKDPYKVLIIEDNLGDFILVSDFMEETILAPEIDHAADFKQAVEKLSLPASSTYNAIFLDLSLPDKSGEELIIQILRIVKQTPVIVLTGYTDASFAIKSLSLGASDYLLKDELSATTLYKSLIYNIERYKTLLRLKESELRYSDLFHLSPQAMFVVNRESYHFLDVNEAAISHYGYSKEEFLGMSLKEIMPEDGFKNYECRGVDGNVDQATFRNLFQLRLKSGVWVDVELRCNLLLFNGIKAEVILANDVTERLTHLKIIQERNSRLKEIAFEQSHVVRAPLSRMMGLINLIKTTQVDQKEELLQLLGYIENSAYEIDGIIREIVRKTETLKQEVNQPSPAMPSSAVQEGSSNRPPTKSPLQRLDQVIQAVDRINATDPNLEADGTPKELAYSQRMTQMLADFEPEASELLQIAARAQHIKRWSIPRDSYPMDRTGYLTWRTKLKKFHGALTGELMQSCGYPVDKIQRVDDLINKRQLKSDGETQCLEDVTCLVFLSHYFEDFLSKHEAEPDKVVDILRKTWKKMSTKGHEAALKLPLSERALTLVKRALEN